MCNGKHCLRAIALPTRRIEANCWKISDSSPKPPDNPPINTLPDCRSLIRWRLGSKFRWPIIQLLADGREMSITEGAKHGRVHRREFQQAPRRDAQGWHRGMQAVAARRRTIFYIPAARRLVPGVIDYGFCKIDLRLA
jgi:hypothetical protein